MKPQGSVLGTFLGIFYEACFLNTDSPSATSPTSKRHLLDRAKVFYGGSYTDSQVEGAKLVTRLSPFFFAMIPYWGIYSQIATTFQNQGCQMDLSFGDIGSVPVSAVSSFDTLAILMLVPVFDQVIYPYCAKHGMPLSTLQRMGK
jgi:dipeptide/tripeptide permease